jgi:chromosome segregation ATPase
MERELSSERTVRILATKRVDELTEECESLTLRNAQLVDENALLLQKLERTNIPARGELVRKATANRALQRRIQVLEERRQKLEATVRSRTKEKRALTAKSQWREGKLQSLEGELAAKVVELAKCQGEVQRLRGELAVKTVDAAQCQGEVQRLRSVLDAKTLDVAQCQASMIELSTLHAELRNLVRGQVLARLGANGGQMKSEQEDQSQAAAALVPQPREGMVHTKCSTVEQDSALRGGQALCEREEEREAELEEANATVRRVSADAELQEEQGAREQLSAAHDELQEHARHLEGELARVSRELDKYRLLSLRRFVG